MNSWKNSLIRRFVISQRPGPPEAGPIRRILVVSTTAMGDTLWATPVLANLRLHFPKAQITVLASPTGQQILENNPQIDQIILLKNPLSLHLFSLLKTLKREAFDAALILHSSQRLVLPLCSLSGIPRIIGTKGINKGLDDLFTDPVDMESEHEIERRLKIMGRLHVPAIIHTLSYYVHASERAAAHQYLGDQDKPLIAIHPGSREPFRRWPSNYFAQVGRALEEKFGCEIFLTGDSSETKLLKKIKETLPRARIVSSPSIRFLGALLERMDLVLSNDTGPFHLACALNRPAVGLYVSTDPLLCGPHHAHRAIAISRSSTCTPCLKRRCRDPFCFLQIPIDEVVDICSNQLRSCLIRQLLTGKL
jgi:lipopolysaccharide heptosyltransferase II